MPASGEKRELENPDDPEAKRAKTGESDDVEMQDQQNTESSAQNNAMDVDDEKQAEADEEESSLDVTDHSADEEEVEGKQEEEVQGDAEQPDQKFFLKTVKVETIAGRKKPRNKLRRVGSTVKLWNGISLEGDDSEDEDEDAPPLLRRQSSWNPNYKKKRKMAATRQKYLAALKKKLKKISREDIAAYKPSHVVWFDICESTGDETWYAVELVSHDFIENGNAAELKVKFCGYSDEEWHIPAIMGDNSYMYWCHKCLLKPRASSLAYPDNLEAVRSHLTNLPRRKKVRSGRSRRGRRSGGRAPRRRGAGPGFTFGRGRRSPSPPPGPPREVTVKGVVTDASDGSKRLPATFEVLSLSTQKSQTVTVGQDGNYECKVWTGMVKISAKSDGYADAEHLMEVKKAMGINPASEVCLSRTIEDNDTIRIVLRWGRDPSDLDSHIFVPNKPDPAVASPSTGPTPATAPPASSSTPAMVEPPASSTVVTAPPASGLFGAPASVASVGGLFGAPASAASAGGLFGAAPSSFSFGGFERAPNAPVAFNFGNGGFFGGNAVRGRIQVYYQNKNYNHNSANINLDRDVTTSYGPETVTISKMDDLPDDIEHLEYIVHHFGGSRDILTSKAIITVYKQNKCVVYKVPTDGWVTGAKYWHVFRINRQTKELETVNNFSVNYPVVDDNIKTVKIPYSTLPIVKPYNTEDWNREEIQLVFSFDTTGSMYSCLKTVRVYLKEIVTKLLKDIPHLSIGIVAHGDYEDVTSSYVMKHIDLTRDVEALCKFIGRVGETCGYDNDECYELVLHNVQRDFSWSSKCKYRSLVLIGDANPHPKDGNNPFKIDWEQEVEGCKQAGIKIYGVHCLGTIYAQEFYKAITSRTGGLYVELTNLDEFTGMMTAICHRELNLALRKAVEDAESTEASSSASSGDGGPEKARFEEECSKLEEYTVKQLQEKLVKNNQKKSGSKRVIIERIVDAKLYGCMPKCTSCGGGRLRVIYQCEWTHNGEGEYWCPGFHDDGEFQYCSWRGSLSDIERKDWVE